MNDCAHGASSGFTVCAMGVTVAKLILQDCRALPKGSSCWARLEVKMDRTVIEVSGISEGIRKARVPLSPAIRANGFVFVSGTPPIDLATGNFIKGDIVRQTKQCLLCLQHVLESAGSSLEKVCKVVIYATDTTQFGLINEVYARFFKEAPPARTFVPVAPWPLDFDIEIECVALA
jgi:reactive intermediate/imine deaminase